MGTAPIQLLAAAAPLRRAGSGKHFTRLCAPLKKTIF